VADELFIHEKSGAPAAASLAGDDRLGDEIGAVTGSLVTAATTGDCPAGDGVTVCGSVIAGAGEFGAFGNENGGDSDSAPDCGCCIHEKSGAADAGESAAGGVDS
jgi:hypothetical protein